jgi:hypothetical protein
VSSFKKIIGLDVLSEEGLSEYMKKDLKMTRCINYVEDAVKIVENMINQNQT